MLFGSKVERTDVATFFPNLNLSKSNLFEMNLVSRHLWDLWEPRIGPSWKRK